MAESTLTSTYEDLRVVAGLEMGWGRDPDTHWTATNETDFGIACKEGYRQFLYPVALPGENKSHNWSFLYPLGFLNLEGAEVPSATATPTITVKGDYGTSYLPEGIGRVSLTGGTYSFPVWSTQGRITIGGGDHSILALETGRGALYVENWPTSKSVTATNSFSITRTYYDLPDDFGGMVSDSFAYARDEQWHLPQIKIVGEAEIRKVDRANDGDEYPRYASIIPVPPAIEIGTVTTSTGLALELDTPDAGSTRWRVRFYPQAEQSYELEYRYHAIPPALDADTNIYHYGGAEHSQTIIAAVIDALYRRVHSSNEKSEEFHNRLKQSILHDRRNYNTGNLGQRLNYTDGRSALRSFRESTPTGNITTTFY